MKQSIIWHEKHLIECRQRLDNQKRTAAILQSKINAEEMRLSGYYTQIQLAKQNGLRLFDRYTYCITTDAEGKKK